MTREIIRYVEQKENETGIIVMDVNFKTKEDVDRYFEMAKKMFEEDFPNCNKLKQFSTAELIKELITRQGVEHGAAGLYKPYEIRRKFVEGPLREPIQADQVIIIRSFEDIRSS